MNYVNLLIKPSSSNCNMKCEYCFYIDESNKRENYSFGFMDIATLDIIVKKALSECTNACNFMFQGGEPTLIGLDFYKKLVELQEKYNVNKINIYNSIQTNGYLIDEKWASFLSKNKFLVGVSLDGFEKVHNKYRKDKANNPTFNNVMNCIELLNKYNVNYNILTVVTKETVKNAKEIYKFYYENSFNYIQYIPCFDELNKSRGLNKFSLTPKLYTKFLKETFDCWYDDCIKNKGISIRNFDNYIMILLGHKPENCAMSGKCSVNAVIEANGDVYPCDFYALDEYLLGNIKKSSFSELLTNKTAKKFLSEQSIDKRCTRCKYGFLCRGGCRRDKINDENSSVNYFCQTYKNFFDYSIDKFIEIAKMKQHPYRFMNE